MIIAASIFGLIYIVSIYLLAKEQHDQRIRHYATRRITYGALAVTRRKLMALEDRPSRVQKYHGVKRKKLKPLLPEYGTGFAMKQKELADKGNAKKIRVGDVGAFGLGGVGGLAESPYIGEAT